MKDPYNPIVTSLNIYKIGLGIWTGLAGFTKDVSGLCFDFTELLDATPLFSILLIRNHFIIDVWIFYVGLYLEFRNNT